MVSAPEVPAAIVLNGSDQPAAHGSSSSNGYTDEPAPYVANGEPSPGSAAPAGLGIADGPANGSHSRLESRRASFQSKELSEMELPEPSWLSQARGQRQLSVNSTSANVAPQTADGLLTTSDRLTATAAGSSSSDNAPMVASIPSSPYTGSGAWSPAGTSVPKFGDTAKYEELLARLEALNLPDPEVLKEGSRVENQEKEKILKELQDVIAEMELPEPEYIQRYVMRSQGAKTPEPELQQPGEAMSPKVARATSIKRAASQRRPNGNRNGEGQAH